MAIKAQGCCYQKIHWKSFLKVIMMIYFMQWQWPLKHRKLCQELYVVKRAILIKLIFFDLCFLNKQKKKKKKRIWSILWIIKTFTLIFDMDCSTSPQGISCISLVQNLQAWLIWLNKLFVFWRFYLSIIS